MEPDILILRQVWDFLTICWMDLRRQSPLVCIEGQPEGNDFTLFSIVVGLADTEYGYASIKEMESISVDVGYNLPKIPILQDKSFKPCPIGNIPDERLQSFLSDMYDREEA